MVTFNKKEVGTLFIASLVIAFTIAFDDKQPTFILRAWLFNYSLTFLLTLLGMALFFASTKYAAKKTGSTTAFELWSVRRVGWSSIAKARTPFYLGVILPIMLAILSEGRIPFGAATQYNIETKSSHRLGKKFIGLTEFEQAKIAAYGPIMLTFLAIILQWFNTPLAERFSYILIVIAVTNLLPLPNLNGMKAFFGSRLLYVFVCAMIIITIPLINVISPIKMILLSVIFGLVIMTLFYNYAFVKAK